MPSSQVSSTPAREQVKSTLPPLAVIGIGCRLPGGIHSPASFWDSLLRGIDAIRDVPDDRWKHARFHDPSPEKAGCIRNAKGGFLDGIDRFDGEFFGYFPAEAQRIDPQQRMLLEVTHEAMEDAGLRRDQLDESRTSVFIGSFMYDYLCLQSSPEQRDQINPYVALGTSVSALANRISYDFNLKGPSVALDTACSSSLVALHMACRSIWGGEADLAIAGGVNAMLRPESSIMLSKAGFLNPDQYCKAFDASANGYVRGEGVGVVILKPLKQALADGDAIYALVRATGVNQDGYTPEGFTVPNFFSQVELLRTVYQEAGIDPLTVAYVEAHGTGTPVGDPIETMALGTVLGEERTSGRPCLIGSVKTNLGHLEGAAGIAGFIKGVLTAHHGTVPPNLHLHEPNPEILWDHFQLEVPTRPALLPRTGQPRIIGVNSFGAGGTNAHVILEEPPNASPPDAGPPDAGPPDAGPPSAEKRAATNGHSAGHSTLYMLSATRRESLQALALRHADFLRDSEAPLADLAYSAFTRRSRYSQLLAVVGDSARHIEEGLRRFADGQVDSTLLTATIHRVKKPKLAFVFSGQGGQWAGMGLQLMKHEPVFRRWLDEIETCFRDLTGGSLLAELRRDAAESRVHDTAVVQPAVMAIQIALARLYEHYEIRPQALVGHSVGEVAAAFVAGALTLEDAVRVIYHRSRIQSRAAGKGGMLAVGLPLDEASRLLASHGGQVSIGAINGPQMLTLTGDTAALAGVAQLLEARGVFHRWVKVQVAYHSHHMDLFQPEMRAALAGIQGTDAMLPLYSTVTGHREDGRHLTQDYWFQNARQPVLFTNAMRNMLHDGYDTFVEIGPHPVLVAGAEGMFRKLEADAMIAPSMTRREPEVTVFLQSLARLAARGVEPDVAVLFGPGRRFVRLPQYPWQHQRHWYETPATAETRRGRFEHPFLKRRTALVTEEGLAVWEASLDLQKSPYLRDHQVDGEHVVPATGHLELAWGVASEQYRHEPFFLEDLRFDAPLMLPDDSRYPLDVQLEIVSGEGDYRICSRPADAPADTPWTRHSSGRINTLHDRFERATESLAELRERWGRDARNSGGGAKQQINVETFYHTIADAGLAYGETFRCIQELWHDGHEMLARLSLPAALLHEARRYTLHPALLDACLHVVFADVHAHGDSRRVFLPYRIERLRFYRQPTSQLWSHVRVTRNDDRYLHSDSLIFAEDGELVAEVRGLVCKRLVGAGSHDGDTRYDGCYEYRWIPAPRQAGVHRRVHDLTRAVLIPPAEEEQDFNLAAELATRLASEGIAPQILRPGPEESLDQLLADTPLDRRTLLVLLASRSECRAGWQGLDACPHVPTLLQLAQTLHRRRGVPRVFIVTNGAAGAEGDRQLDLGQALLHGMARVIQNECPSIPVTVVDLSELISPQDIESLIEELCHTRHDRDETEITLRGAERWIRQLIGIDAESAELSASTLEPGCGGGYQAEVPVPGALDQIAFRRRVPGDVGRQEVEIAVQSAALNFKDVMNTMGLLPEHAVAGGLAGKSLGLEVAGRVLRTGSLVRHVQPGDDVLARVAGGFAGRVIAPGPCVVKRPRTLTPQQAAAVPVVYVTAWYALHHLARVEPGETILIHSAAGGVGSAAIQLALRAGCRVIATAGTKNKRSYLRQQGIDHAFDSRSLDFHSQVMDVTGGRGVDVIVNSLTGRFITQSLKCLAPFGRFIELGKSDIYRNSKLSLERLGENISYFAVDVDRLAAQKPELHRELLEKVVSHFEKGELTPPELTEFPISRLPDAMKFMTRAAYQGKIVLQMQGDQVPTLPPRSVLLRPDRSYLISGGASGFGLEIARWMVQQGARQLVLLSRSGCKSAGDRRTVESLRAAGAEVLLLQADVADANQVQESWERMQRELPPLAGIIHGAAVLADASLPTMDMPRFRRAFAPKGQGAWNLHQAATATGADLDFFVMLSSISSVLGLVGQLNYAAANYFQDALALYRRQRGLPGTSVNLGVLGPYAGMSRGEKDVQEIVGLLESQGMPAMRLPDVLAKLEAALVQQPAQRMTSCFDWGRFRAAYPHLARDARFVELMSDAALARGNRSKGACLRAVLSEMEPAQQRERLEQELAARLGRMLDVAPEKLAPAASIDVLGLDSLMLTDLQVWIMRMLDTHLPLIKLLKGPSITSLASDLLAQLQSGGRAAATDAADLDPPSSPFTLADLDGVSVVNPWLIRGRCSSEAAYRVICFHSMGVGASLFTKFLLHPPEGCDLLALQTPGRENRMAEPVVQDLHELMDRIVPELVPLFDRPVIFWGHSFGGIVAHEAIRRLQERFDAEPIHLVVTGTVPPHLIHLWQKREVLLKAMVTDHSAEYLISLARYVDDSEFLKSILPLMRRDYPLLKNYRYRPSPPLDFPITAFAARQDDFIYTDEIREWKKHTSREFSLTEVDGDHWFLSRNRERISLTLQAIARRFAAPFANPVDQSADTIFGR